VSYIESTKEAFPSYVKYAQAKFEKGFGYSDFTLTEMRNYLKDVLEQGSEYYLKDVINAKIDASSFLDDSQKSEYKTKVANAIKDCFIPGVQELYDGLEPLLGKIKTEEEGYLTKYENGKDLYLLELGKLLGIDNLDMTEYIRELDAAIESAELVGLPEAIIPLSVIVIELALSPKSNSAYTAINNALNDIRKGNTGNVPSHIKTNSPLYKYPHDYPKYWVKQQYLPDKIKNKKYYTKKTNNYETNLNKINNEMRNELWII